MASPLNYECPACGTPRLVRYADGPVLAACVERVDAPIDSAVRVAGRPVAIHAARILAADPKATPPRLPAGFCRRGRGHIGPHASFALDRLAPGSHFCAVARARWQLDAHPADESRT